MNKTTKCQHCGIEVVLPFKCSYCHGYFCSEHRLPENHACPEYWRARAPREAAEPTKPAYKYTITYLPRPTAKVFWFSTTELKHLALGALLVMGVGLSFTPQFADHPEILASLATVFTFSFLLHELAHKISAQRLGLWAEFRLTMFGALITLLSMLPTPFKIISPGAVMIAGPMTKESAGKTALAGPFINIVLSTICIMIAISTQSAFLWIIAVFGAWINAFIAFFNLIPFGVLDGLKVFWWNKMVWTVAFSVSLPLTIFAFWTLATL